MKNIILVFMLSVVVAYPASSQTAKNTWGLGVSFGSSSTVFHIPIVFEQIRLEPEISVRASSSDNANTFFSTSSSRNTSNAFSTSGSSRSFSIGWGAYYIFRIENVADWYAGPRAGITYNSSTSDQVITFTDTSFQQTTTDHTKQHSWSYFGGAVFGGEYYLSAHFSVGAELQATYSYTGQPVIEEQIHTVSPSENFNSFSVRGPSSSSAFNASTAVYIRWYF